MPTHLVRLKKTLRWLVALTSLLLLFLLCNPRQIVSTLAAAELGYVALSFALMLLIVGVRTWRWKRVLEDVGMVSPPFLRLLESNLVSGYFSLFLPGNVGGDAYRAYDLAKMSARTLRPIATVLIERITGVLALLVIGMASVVLFRDDLPFPAGILLAWCGGLLACLALGVWMAAYGEVVFGVAQPFLPAGLLRKIPMDKLQAVFEIIRDLRGRHRAFVRAFVTGFLMQAIVLYTYHTCARALGREIPLKLFFVFFPLIEFSGIIPITINGIGVKEGLTVYFLRTAGVAPSFAMSLSILARAVSLITGLLGGALLWVRKKSVKHEAAGGF